ncbi:hypothetical protein Barb4_02337 [Bacteroidales bacterium Barb4]|nr:hypothetical protein Barb4_02337 [Bacteroidales bacterium Barb4]
MYLFVLFFQNSLVGIVPLTPHSAPLHVGLKSLALSGQGYRNDPVRGILKGYRISAPHGAQRNVG